MLCGVADTHTAIWYLFGDPRLSLTAKATLDKAASDGNQVGISAITLAEIVYLAEKGRIPSLTFDRVVEALDSPNNVLLEIPFDREIAAALKGVDRERVADLPDRVIAATALHWRVPLISRDSKIQVSGVPTIW